jgi:hypothetical protein
MLAHMSVVPGWYPDPAQPSRLRLWDGSDWTKQTMQAGDSAAFTGPTSGAAGGPAVPKELPSAPSSPRRPLKAGSARWITAAAVVVVGALIVGIVWGAIGGSSKKATPAATASPASTVAPAAGCTNPVPVGALPAAVDYLKALEAARPSWAAVSAKLSAQNRVAVASDMAPAAAAEGIYLTALRRISFPAADVAAAQQLMTAVAQYRNLLLSDAKNFALFAKQSPQRLVITAARSTATSRLRTQLGLPAATCDYLRP